MESIIVEAGLAVILTSAVTVTGGLLLGALGIIPSFPYTFPWVRCEDKQDGN